jgi:hypothetical protein
MSAPEPQRLSRIMPHWSRRVSRNGAGQQTLFGCGAIPLGFPPAYVSDALTCLEVPEYFHLAGRHYLTYTTSYHFGTPYPVRDPFQATGTFYLTSDDVLSGYHAPDRADALTASLPDAVANYVGRSIPHAGDSRRRWYTYQHVFPPRAGESLAGSLGARAAF